MIGFLNVVRLRAASNQGKNSTKFAYFYRTAANITLNSLFFIVYYEIFIQKVFKKA